MPCTAPANESLEFRDEGLGFRVLGLRYGDYGLGFRGLKWGRDFMHMSYTQRVLNYQAALVVDKKSCLRLHACFPKGPCRYRV